MRLQGSQAPPLYVRGQRARLIEGVNIFGYVYAEHGVGEGVRQLVRVARDASLPLAVVPYGTVGSRQSALFEGVGTETLHDVNLICVNADSVELFLRLVGHGILRGRYNVALWCWEVESLPPWMAEAARFFDEIWSCSSYAAETIARAVPVPVYAWPWPLSAAAEPPPDDPGPSGDDFRFLFCFDYNSVFERKNPLGLVAAYRLAFPPGCGARLLIKSINGELFPEQEMRLLDGATGHPDIEVVDGYLDRGEQRVLMNACDAYVSLHRAEGLGITLAEAMALGKPVVATAYSGNLDFMDETTAYLVPCGRVPIPHGCGPYPAGTPWGEPDLEAAARVLRWVFEHREEARSRGEAARAHILRTLRPEAWKAFVTERLAAIRLSLASRPRPTPPFVSVRPGAACLGASPASSHAFRSLPSARLLLDQPLGVTADLLLPGLPCGAVDGLWRRPGGGLTAWGWAQDPRVYRPACGVSLRINRQPVPMRLAVGGERPDIAGIFASPPLARSGWICHLPASLVPSGPVRLEAFAVLGDGRFGPAGAADA